MGMLLSDGASYKPDFHWPCGVLPMACRLLRILLETRRHALYCEKILESVGVIDP